MNGLNKGTGTAGVQVKWDPSPLGEPPCDLDLIAATYRAADPEGPPAYLVYFDSRSPDGTITLDRDSRTGKGLGFDEAMTLELDRLGDDYGRVVVGVAIQQDHGRKVFGDVAGTGYRVVAGREVLEAGGFASVADATAATLAEFTREGTGGPWTFRTFLRGFDGEPNTFAREMGGPAR